MIKRNSIISAVVLLAAVLTALVWLLVFYLPGYDRARVHPDLLALKQPFSSVKAHYYFDGGSIGVELTDATGRKQRLALPCAVDGRPPPNGQKGNYSRLLIGTLHHSRPGGVPVEFTEDSKRFIAEIIDKDVDQGWDRVWALNYLRHERLDRLRVWWRGHFPYEELP